MAITTLLFYILIISGIMTFVMGKLIRGHKSWLMTFLQNYCGVLFIISGYVKAVDPLGTAYKMEQYFAEFEGVFSETMLSSVAPLFPFLSEHSISFSVGMIVLEIVLGVMLIIGLKPKFTSWAFFLLIVVFTFLTGFTYLTGYVPQGVNFFDFANWGEYVKTNMKVTDCGCFGDFIKLEPFNSFLKDVALLFPSVYFILQYKKMHQIFGKRTRTAIGVLSFAAISLLCMSNYVWDLPSIDFRPFYEGQNVRAQKEAEIQAEQDREITHYKMTEKATGKVVELPYDRFLKEFKKYPKADWEYDQIRTEPAIPSTKISEFELSGPDGADGTEDLLNDENYNFWVVSYKIPSQSETSTIMVPDTTWAVDTVLIEGTDSTTLVRSVAEINQKELSKTTYTFDKDFVEKYSKIINPLAEKAEKDGFKTRVLTKYEDPAKIDDFRHTAQTAYPFYTGDDILLKTIIRSNPGVLLMKDGTIIKKWHVSKLPSYETIKSEFMK